VAHACNTSYSVGRDRRIVVQSQPGGLWFKASLEELFPQDPISEKPFTKIRADVVVQGVSPEFKPQY
jgi:hypothetical protein